MEKKIIISIVTWNSAKTITECVKSVLAQSVSEFQLFIVDNDSRDDTCKILESFNDDRIRLVKQKKNTGFCGGHNYVIANSESEYVLLVNPDIVMAADYLERAIATFQTKEKVGTVCGLLLQSDSAEAIIDSAGLEMKSSRVMRMKHHGEVRDESKLNKEEIFGADGALPLYSRQMIKDISIDGQFFDELFFAHKEDWDVSWRSYLYGWKTIFNPECIAIHPRHFKPKSLKVRSEINSEIKIHSVKNQLILLLKNESLSSFLRNCIPILSRQIFILSYIVFMERSSLKAYKFVFNNFPEIKQKRKIIQSRRVL